MTSADPQVVDGPAKQRCSASASLPAVLPTTPSRSSRSVTRCHGHAGGTEILAHHATGDIERADRRDELARGEDQARGPRLLQEPSQLPAAGPLALRRDQMDAHSTMTIRRRSPSSVV